MSEENSQEKTHDPTPKRKKDAREKGTVLRSKELNTTVVLLSGAGSLIFFGSHLIGVVSNAMVSSFNFRAEWLINTNSMSMQLGSSFLRVFFATIPVFLLLYVAAILGSTILGGWNFSFKSMAPKFEKLSPLKGLKRMFSAKSLMELIKAFLKFLLVLVVSIIFMKLAFTKILSLEDEPVNKAILDGITIIGFAFMVLSLPMILISLIDVPFQIWDHNKKLKMSFQEVKEEMKQTEGSPEVKQKVRQMQQGAAQRRMMSEIEKANVVLVNPEHYSVALYYDRQKCPTPRVIAKGVDFMAFKIREVATKHQVEIVSSPALARSLYYSTDLNREIPTGLYLAVAQVLTYVYQLKRYQAGHGERPASVTNLEIPEDLQHE